MPGKFIFLTIIFFTRNCIAMHVKTEINNTSTAIALDEHFEKKAQEAYQDLGSLPFFNSNLLRNNAELCRELKKTVSSEFSIQTADNANICCTFFDRGSDNLMIIGPGFPTPRQKMAPFIHIFSDYDVILFDYRGQGLEHTPQWSWHPLQWFGSLIYQCFGIDMHITGLGTIEAADVRAVVHAMRDKKNYTKIFGLGLCYSSFIFAQAAAQEPELFDKLILDGSWPSLKNVIKKIAQDPSLVCAKHPPSSPFPWLTHKACFKNSACTLIELLTALDLDRIPSLSHYLAKLNMPILFFQCTNDCYCSLEEFETLWQATHAHKTAIFTKNVHGKNHLWQKELYAYLCNQFLKNDQEVFTHTILPS